MTNFHADEREIRFWSNRQVVTPHMENDYQEMQYSDSSKIKRYY